MTKHISLLQNVSQYSPVMSRVDTIINFNPEEKCLINLLTDDTVNRNIYILEGFLNYFWIKPMVSRRNFGSQDFNLYWKTSGGF